MSYFERQNAATVNLLPEVPLENYIVTDCYDLHRPEEQIAKLPDSQRGRDTIPGVVHHGASWLFIKPTPSLYVYSPSSDVGTLLPRAGPSHSVCWKSGEDYEGTKELLKPQTVYKVLAASTGVR